MRLAGWFGRHKLFVAALCLIAAVTYVPMFPYSPRCYSPDVDDLNEKHFVTPYRTVFTELLESFKVHYVVVGDVVLLRFWDWFADPDSWVANASNKAVATLVDRKFNPQLEDPPERIKALAEAARDPQGFIEPTCELVRAVAIEGW
jgi:hypothetical protein